MRERIVALALEWQKRYGVAPSITPALSECDAAIFLVGMPEDEYSEYMKPRTAVSRGHDFEFNGEKYQIKAHRPSGKPGSAITNAGPVLKKDTATGRYKWNFLIWIRYNKDYQIEEAWMFSEACYGNEFGDRKGGNLSPEDMRKGLDVTKKAPEEILARHNQ